MFYISRYFNLPEELQKQPAPIERLPAFESLLPFDPENKWVLTASLEVSNGKDQELMKQGTEELLDIKSQFEGCFDFEIMHRHLFDTRVKLET